MKKEKQKPQETKNKCGLTEKERLFCAFYAGNGFNASKAARDAGYSEKTSKEIGCNLLTKINIRAEIERLKQNFEEQVNALGITKIGILLKHWEIANSSIAHLHNTWIELKEFEKLTDEQKAIIKEIDTKTEIRQIPSFDSENMTQQMVEVKWVRVSLYDKQKALDSIAKMMGWNEKTQIDLDLSNSDKSLSNKVDISKLSTPTLKELIRAGYIRQDS